MSSLKYCDWCGGEFEIKFISNYPYKIYPEIYEEYYSHCDGNILFRDLSNQIKKDGINGGII